MNIDEHLLNVGASGLPEHLYRIVPLERFLLACHSSRNTLVSPANWTDPYEAAQLRTQIEYPLFVDEKGVYSSGMRDNIPRKVGGTWRTGALAAANSFCQCWSNLPESDAMWRLYSPDRMGVKLRARPRELLLSLHTSTLSEKVFLGAVDYLAQEDFDALIRDAKQNHLIQRRPNLFETIPGEAWARCLLRKRKQFAHESEYRLILAQTHPDMKSEVEPLFHYTVSFGELIDEIELDPRCNEIDAIEKQLRGVGYTGPVRRSRLYEAPNLCFRPSWPEHNDWSVGSERKWVEKGIK